jgi:cell division septation protein DedD
MKRIIPLVPFALILFTLWGCSSSQEASEATSSSTEADREARQSLGFETRVDTVKTESEGTQAKAAETAQEQGVRFMIQIGAYKDARNASRIQGIARERYHLPVLNDYNMLLGLYQIRIGVFETREQATMFRQRIQSEYPSEYKDAWIVQLNK